MLSSSRHSHLRYVQQAICNPTRSSFLTGRRPDATKVWDLHTQFRLSGGNFTTLPQYFNEQGYWTSGMGKVFHPIPYKGQTDDVAGGSWSAPYFHAHGLGSNMSMCWTENPGSDAEFQDMILTAHAVEVLRNASAARAAADGGVPFFVAVGLHRPHLPWDVPARGSLIAVSRRSGRRRGPTESGAVLHRPRVR